MNCQQANNIDIVSFLNKKGFVPIKKENNNIWYKSPFRDEKTASFKVDSIINVWFDFGEGVGGKMIDLIIKLKNCSPKEALDFINQNESFSFHQQKNLIIELNQPEILDVLDITNKYLLQYIKERKLKLEFVKKYCFEVHYAINNKRYYGIGFMNNKGGFEIRNKYFKGVIGKKAITSIFNHQNSTSLFESWSDFISYLTYFDFVPNENFIILNSTSMLNHAIELLDEKSQIKCYFDNDIAGDKATNRLISLYGNRVIDQRFLYENLKDFNDYLIK